MQNNSPSENPLLTACAKLAQHIVKSYHDDYPSCDDVVACGDPAAPATTESMKSILEAYTQQMPNLMRATSAELTPLAQRQLEADQAVTPGYNQLSFDTYAKYGPQLNQIGNEIARQNAMSQAGTESAVLAGPGQELIRQGLAAAKLADPEYYKSREVMSNKLNSAIGAMSPTMSAAENEALSRGIAQSNMQRGLSTSPSQLTTVSNAMQFGNAQTQKATNLANTIGQASQSLGQFRSGIDPFQVATGRASSANTGENKFAGSSTGSGSQAFGMGNALLGSATSIKQSEMDVNANRRDAMDRVQQGIDTANAPLKACCWIFMEAYNGQMPWWVRRCRDAFWTEERQEGYRMCARVLVPLMRRYSFARQLVNDLMIAPLTAYGGHLYRVKGYEDGSKYSLHTRTWFAIWNTLGWLKSKLSK